MGGLVAAAGIAVVILLPGAPQQTRTVRSTQAIDRSGQVLPVRPSDGDTIASAQAAFVWHPDGADLYHFSLLAEDGAPVWDAETADTTMVLPAGITLRAGSAYFWRVDAIADGIAASSGSHRFVVAP
jgi:hypothetical protein